MCIKQLKFKVAWKRREFDAALPKCCINLDFAANKIIKHFFHNNISHRNVRD